MTKTNLRTGAAAKSRLCVAPGAVANWAIGHAMRNFPVLLSLMLLLVGCESLPQNMRERFAPVPPRLATFDADARSVYFAAQIAFKRLDYTLVRSSISGFRIEAASRINSSAAFQDSRQLVAYLAIEDIGPAQSEVSMRLVEQLEGRGIGGSSELALREHGFYETYFAVLKQVLEEQARAGVVQKN